MIDLMSKRIYNAVKKDDYHNFPELEPYKEVLETCFEHEDLYREDRGKSNWYVRSIIDLVTRYPADKVNKLDKEFLRKYIFNYLDSGIEHFRALLAPSKSFNDHALIYTRNFDYLLAVGEMLLRNNILTNWDGLDKLVVRYKKICQCGGFEQVILRMASAYYYAHQDRYDISVLEEFYRRYEQCADRIVCNLNDLIDIELAWRFFYSENINKINDIYSYIIESFNEIKENKVKRIII